MTAENRERERERHTQRGKKINEEKSQQQQN